jgi:hypothetical protein
MKGIIGAIIGVVIVIVIYNVGYRYYTTSGADTYIVVDLSGGPSVTSYPVSKLSDVPGGGWSEEYKTTKLVLRYSRRCARNGYYLNRGLLCWRF